jgi:hypothetical protein
LVRTIALLLTGLLLTCSSVAQQTSQPVRLNLTWYLDATADMDIAAGELPQATVRHLTTSTFFPLAWQLYQSPDVSTTLCISSETLKALVDYVARLREFIDLNNNTIDADSYLKKYGGETDPWLDILLKPSTALSAKELDMMLNISKKQKHHAFSVSESVLKRFPEYAQLLPSDMQVGQIIGTQNRALYTVRDRIRIKFFYTIAHFDLSLLTTKYVLPLYAANGRLIDPRTGRGQALTLELTDYFTCDNNNTPDNLTDDRYELARPIGEDDCQRLVVETYKMMEMVLFMLRQGTKAPAGITQSKNSKEKQKTYNIDVATTPAFNALLPLLIDFSAAQDALGEAADLPLKLHAQADAKAHVMRAAYRFKSWIGELPKGFVPHALMVSQASLGLYEELGKVWLLCPKEALAKALKKDKSQIQPAEIASPYQAKGSKVWLLFDETDAVESLKSRLQAKNWQEEMRTWFESLSMYAGSQNLLTLCIDLSMLLHHNLQASQFLSTFFNAINVQSKGKKSSIITLRPSALFEAQPKSKQSQIKQLNALPLSANVSLETWIDNKEKQLAWTYLALVRADLEKTNVAPPPTDVECKPLKASKAQAESGCTAEQRAWFELYAAQQAFWFERYGQKVAESNSELEEMDRNFRAHLEQVYEQLARAGIAVERRTLAPIILPQERRPQRMLDANEIQCDGLLTEAEWFESAGVFSPDHAEDLPLEKCYYGITNDAFYFAAVAKSDNLKALLSDTTVRLSLLLAFEENSVLEFPLRPVKQAGSQLKLAISEKALEVIVPYSELRLANRIGFLGAIAGQKRVHDKDAYLGMALSWQKGEKVVRFPKENFRTVQEDIVNTVEVRFELDLSAYPTARRAELEILKPQLSAQKILLRDDGRQGDEKRNDKIWSARLRLRRGELIEYRYWVEQKSEGLERPRVWRVDDGVNTPGRAVVQDTFEKLVR